MTKIGRNVPCPCGSGKKYKNCCAIRKKLSSTRKITIVVVVFVLLAITGVFLLYSGKSTPANSFSGRILPFTASNTVSRTASDTASRADLPGVDFLGLTGGQQEEVMQQANQQNCTCSCGLTIAACRRSMGTTCSTSLSIAQGIVRKAVSTIP